jgi:Sap-like sulfolipid-1-addressing protein
MWGSILVVALLFALNPGVLGVIVLLISRPRPVQNLLAFWFGSVVVSVPLLLVPLTMLHLAPTSISFAHDLATPASPMARHIQIGMGMLTLLIATIMTVRFLVRRPTASADPGARRRSGGRHRMRRGRERTLNASSGTSTLVLEADTPDETSASGSAQDAATEGGSFIRRLIRRAYAAWEKGSVWIAFVFGMTLFPGPPLALFVVTTIVSSGVSFGTEIIAAMAFVVTMLGLVEIILVSHLATPMRTQRALRPLHVWARAHRQVVVISILAIIGIWQVFRGAGIA